MMKTRLLFLLLLLTIVGRTHGEGLQADGVELTAGGTATVALRLDNGGSAFTAFQFDLVLPDGITIEQNGNGTLDARLNTNRAADHVLTVSMVGEGRYRLLAYSPTNQPLRGTSGALVYVVLRASRQLDEATLTASIQKQLFTMANGTEQTFANVNLTVTVAVAWPTLTVPVVPIMAGTERTVSVTMQNPGRPVAAFQMDIALPDGITLTKASLNESRQQGHSLSVTHRSDGTYRLLSYSLSNAVFTGDDGPLVDLTLKGGEAISEGTLYGTLLKPVLTTANGTQYKLGDVTFDIKVIEQKEGRQTIRLQKGWNWVSFSVASGGSWEALTILAPIKGNIKRLMSHTQELIYDTQLGLVGNLETLSPLSGYRLLVDADATLSIEGTVCNPLFYPIELRKGWNWISYLPAKTMPVADALALMSPSEGDRIVAGDDTEAVFTNHSWTGTLENLEPGKCYQFFANQPTTFVFPDE